MNILVLGNGFDIAHNLPTGYKDFLHFTDVFTEFKAKRRVSGNHAPVKEDKKEQQLIKYLVDLFNRASTDKTSEKLVQEIEELITDNKWIEHFKTINIAQGWVDFEREIAQVIMAFDEVRIQTLSDIRRGGKGARLTSYQVAVLKPFIGQATLIASMEPLDFWKDKLLQDLNRLTRCLEIYLCDYVEKISVKNKLPDIEELKIHAVLSFNYTDTYRANYVTDPTNVECDFIHGEAKIDNTKHSCNMVIGIDEYLEGTDREKDNEYIQFKKFFQRIYKATGCDYVDWLERSKPRPGEMYYPSETNVYIYGHSLDVTDKDILEKLITADNVRTTIFYHSKEALERQIINLVKVISEDELIRRTGTKNIVFKKIRE